MGSLVLTVTQHRGHNLHKNFTMKSLLIFTTIFLTTSASKVRNVYWNTSTASLQQEPTIVTVNEGNLPWEYDQVNIICPVYKPGTRQGEQHIIYSVEKEEFDTCRVTSPRPKIVAICNRPQTFMYFTITFRSFTPTPGGLEFRPGKEYYFISTSNNKDIHRRVGGWCSSHNMKMIFKVAENADSEKVMESVTQNPIPSPAASGQSSERRKLQEEILCLRIPPQNTNRVKETH